MSPSFVFFFFSYDLFLDAKPSFFFFLLSRIACPKINTDLVITFQLRFDLLVLSVGFVSYLYTPLFVKVYADI